MNTNQIAHIASLVGEPARTAMLMELLDGRSLTAHELAGAGNVSPQTASRHLALLVEGGLLRVEQHGRHRYHRLASAEVARVLEGITQLAAQNAPPLRRAVVPGPKDAAMRMARSCYDHIAGRLGVAIAQHLVADGAVVFDGEAGHATDKAGAVLARLGIDLAASLPGTGTRRPYCRPCLDWSERRFHVAGQLGTLICTHSLERGWLLRRQGMRALEITPKGVMALRGWMGQESWRQVTEGNAFPARQERRTVAV
ncbi:putative transcriptional regulator [Polaromonas sp. CF318]|uniref:ArsR/SmtB family transcription factor n=1 Tax=Polaromonas sp. CF318 TaxID=1144318 RepID=UPI0002714C00|nr:helix-turn-helix transcriptional regulator [Polaromonas sp. CF318]EJL89514.1 putative transcriptional regulator [Polaromonas sp. CF318]